jgi:AcrR family transcriptional regulator
LAVAEQVFAAKGFEGASTREIASKAGVNISSLHYHWDCKETLYFAVFQHLYERIVEIVREVSTLPSDQPVSMNDFVEQAMGRLFDFFFDNPTIPRLLVRRLVEDDDVDLRSNATCWCRRGAFLGVDGAFRKGPMSDQDSMMFMLTTYSTMLCFRSTAESSAASWAAACTTRRWRPRALAPDPAQPAPAPLRSEPCAL